MNDSDINDCWNTIGVWRQGAEICPRLSSVVHCRNCDVYINAGLSLLDREVPDSYTDDNSKIYNVANLVTNCEYISCLIFRLGNEWHAIKSAILNEICEISAIHSIPHNTRSALEGLVNIHGEMQICISLAQLIIKEKPLNNNHKIKSRLVLIQLDSGKYTFHACEIMGIYPISTLELVTPPATIANADQQLTEAVFKFNDQSVGLINTHYLNSTLTETIS